MLATIVKRELIDHLLSLRFGLALVLTVGLMVLNALGFVGGSYEFRRDLYIEQVQAEQEIGRSHAQQGLWKLIVHGGQDYIYKKPSPLMFCAVGANDALPERVWTPSWQFNYNDIMFYDPLVILYWDIRDNWDPNESQLMKARALDWVFIIGGLLSLMALLFTFDAFIGEKERGTLKLVMAQSLPRHTLLLGKFLGAMLALALVLSLALVVNLLVVLALSKVNLGPRRGRAHRRHGRPVADVSSLLCRVGPVGVHTEQHHPLQFGERVVAVDLRGVALAGGRRCLSRSRGGPRIRGGGCNGVGVQRSRKKEN